MGLTAAAVTAAIVLPDVAEAAQPGVSASLKNFLLSIVSGGVVLGFIVGAVVGVANSILSSGPEERESTGLVIIVILSN